MKMPIARDPSALDDSANGNRKRFRKGRIGATARESGSDAIKVAEQYMQRGFW